jgi:hypothetical protein
MLIGGLHVRINAVPSQLHTPGCLDPIGQVSLVSLKLCRETATIPLMVSLLTLISVHIATYLIPLFIYVANFLFFIVQFR